jgi:hypothetical protein
MAQSQLFDHINNGQRKARSQGNLTTVTLGVASGSVKGYTGERSPHLEPAKPRRDRCRFADLENSAADSPARIKRMYEEGPYFGRIVARIEQRIFAAGAVVASVERLALAPASTAGHNRHTSHATSRRIRSCLIQRLSDKIGAIFNQLGVHAKNHLQGLLSLFRRVVGGLQATDGGANELLQCRNVSEDSLSDGEKHAMCA